MQTIRMMPEWDCWPLWWEGGENVGNIDPSTLPLSDSLIQALAEWADRFDETYNRADPAASGFKSNDASLQFDKIGKQLWWQLQTELTGNYQVTYWDIKNSVQLEPNQWLFTKAQFAVLLETAVGSPFMLDNSALADLDLNPIDIKNARDDLVQARHVDGAIVSPLLAQLLLTMLTPGYKCITQLRSQQSRWVQVALHPGADGIVGEALNHDETRLLASLEDMNEALAWLLTHIPAKSKDTESSSPQLLEALLPQVQTAVTMLILNFTQETDTAETAVMWFITDTGIWLSDNQVDEGYAIPVTKEALHTRLYNIIKSTMPDQALSPRADKHLK